jgi:hypothetical protein
MEAHLFVTTRADLIIRMKVLYVAGAAVQSLDTMQGQEARTENID